MKLLCVMILSIVSATNLLAEGGTTQRDVDYSKKIIGTWTWKGRANGIEGAGVETYLSNGMVKAKGWMKTPNRGLEQWDWLGSWKIRGGVLISENLEAKHGTMKAGERYETKITFSLDKSASAFKIESTEGGGDVKKGTAVIYHRVKSQSGKGDI